MLRRGAESRDTGADETSPAVNDQIDAAYRSKYWRYGGTYVEPMVSPAARAATLRLVAA